MPLKDVQSARDERGVAIDLVGVGNVRCPMVVLDKARERQNTVGVFALSVSLPHEFKGTHLSRFLEALNQHRGEITMRTLLSLLADIKTRLRAARARVEVAFPYFLERSAPVSGAKGLMDYECGFVGELNGGSADFVLRVRVPVTTLCPCSKEISDYGAHNQRSYVTIEIRPRQDADGPALVWIEDLIELAERSASAPVFAVLKREDERHVTMAAYDHPAFVEDVVRDVALGLRDDARVTWFRVSVQSQESIHNHDAFAMVESDPHPGPAVTALDGVASARVVLPDSRFSVTTRPES